MNILSNIESVLRSGTDLAKEFNEVRSPRVEPTVIKVENPAEPPKNYMPVILGSVAALAVIVGLVFALRKKK